MQLETKVSSVWAVFLFYFRQKSLTCHQALKLQFKAKLKVFMSRLPLKLGQILI